MAAIDLQPTVADPGLQNIPVTSAAQSADFVTPDPYTSVKQAQDTYAGTAEANVRKIQAEQKARQLKNDASFNTLGTLEQDEIMTYQRQYGAVPRDANGAIDYGKIRQHTEEDARMRRSNFKIAASMAGLKYNEGLKLNPATGQHEMVIQMIDPTTLEVVRESFLGTTPADGSLVPGMSGSGKGGFTALQTTEEATAINASKEVHKDVKRAKDIITEINAVGPLVGETLAGGPLWGRVKAVFGNEGQFNAQRTLERLLSAQTIENANKLKGPLTEKELGFLRNSIPKLSDTEETWALWLDDLDKYLTRAIAEREAYLKGTPMTAAQLAAISPPGRGGVAMAAQQAGVQAAPVTPAPAQAPSMQTMPNPAAGQAPTMTPMSQIPIPAMDTVATG
jgi:hypothetical protein